MSAEDLQAADEGEIFGPALRFADLAADHVPLRLLTGDDVEERFERRILDALGVVAIIGSSGAGKSSMIAAKLTELAARGSVGPGGRHVLPLRVPVAPAGPAVAEPITFGRLAIAEVQRLVADVLSGEQQRRLDEAAAHHVLRRSRAAGMTFNFELKPLPGLGGGVAREVQAATTEMLRLGEDPNAVLGGLDALVDMLRAQDREPVLIIEDTDQWATRPDGDEIADGFFTKIVHALARELDVCSVVAVQDTYTGRHSFEAIRELVYVLDLPPVTDAAGTLREVIAARVHDYLGGPADASRVVDGRALVALADRYSETRNLRTTLRALRAAVELSGPGYPEVLTYDHVVAGVADG
jgi:hypothetical protein